MKDIKVMYRSISDCWATPKEVFDKYDAIYHFETDVCATAGNTKCDRFFSPEQDGLKQEWTGVCWCNPPYERQLSKWVKKAAESNAVVGMLIPARTDTRWFHDYVLKYGEIEFIKGRIKFVGAIDNAPFPSMFVLFGKDKLTSNENRID